VDRDRRLDGETVLFDLGGGEVDLRRGLVQLCRRHDGISVPRSAGLAHTVMSHLQYFVMGTWHGRLLFDAIARRAVIKTALTKTAFTATPTMWTRSCWTCCSNRPPPIARRKSLKPSLLAPLDVNRFFPPCECPSWPFGVRTIPFSRSTTGSRPCPVGTGSTT
jgi:hypothetical protein